MQGSLGYNLGVPQRYLFPLLKELLTYAYDPKATPKECLELKILIGLVPNFQIVKVL